MATEFKGYLIKTPVGIFPNEYIMHDTYKQTPNQRADLDSKRNTQGKLIRHELPYVTTTIKFSTIPMKLSKKIKFQKYFPSRTRITLEYWNDEENKYKTADFYIPDIEYSMYGFLDGEPFYLSTPIEIIGYGEKMG